MCGEREEEVLYLCVRLRVILQMVVSSRHHRRWLAKIIHRRFPHATPRHVTRGRRSASTRFNDSRRERAGGAARPRRTDT